MTEDIPKMAFDAWNTTAKPLGWRVALVLTEARRKTLKRAMGDYGGLVGFEDALKRASKSPFLLGRTDRKPEHRNWKPDLDFICQPKTITKLLEGAYDGEEERPGRLHIPAGLSTPKQPEAKPFVPEPPEVRLAAMAASYRKVGRYADANRVEEQLAKLTGKPAVLVPAPDVAKLGMPDIVCRRDAPPIFPKKAPTITEIEADGYEFIPEGENYGSE